MKSDEIPTILGWTEIGRTTTTNYHYYIVPTLLNTCIDGFKLLPTACWPHHVYVLLCQNIFYTLPVHQRGAEDGRYFEGPSVEGYLKKARQCRTTENRKIYVHLPSTDEKA